MNELKEIIVDLLGYMKETRKYYISLLIALLVLMGTVIVLTEGSAVMPSIYTLF